MDNTLHLLPHLLITLLPNVGNHRYWQLINALGSVENVLNTDPRELTVLSSQAKTLLARYQRNTRDNPLVELALTIIEQVSNLDGFMIGVHDQSYPPLLKEIDQPPPVLFGKGSISCLQLPQLAIVGSRHASQSGLQNARLFAQHLSKSGFVITSGLALGIDAEAHQATVDQNKPTIAVMATGIEGRYPKRNHHLAEQIVDIGGTLLTEFIPNTPPKAGHFPKRNRIISGLSGGVLVVESSIKSGSLITARLAMEQGREVFAIPGSIHHPQAKGGHWLIKPGATLVENSQDIVDQLLGQFAYWNEQVKPLTEPQNTVKNNTVELNKNERLILEALPYHPISMDHIIEVTGLSSDIVLATIVQLEITGLIKHSTWGYERL